MGERVQLSCAPPMIVRMSEAWPGQSTRVICIAPASSWPTSCSGNSVTNDEKPRSSVIPRSLLCGCLSKHAVEPMVESARERLVFPESTWPRMPTLMFSVFAGDGFSPSAILGVGMVESAVAARPHTKSHLRE